MIDNTDKFLNQIDEEVHKRLLEATLAVEADAKKECPKKTGRLARSITHHIEGTTAEVGTNVKYAPHVEWGTRHMEAQSFLRKSLHQNFQKIKRIFGAK